MRPTIDVVLFVSSALLMGMAPRSLAADPPLSVGAWTLVHIPDTQNYVADPDYSNHATQQMQWIASQVQARHIKFAVHVGDLVNNNNATQWGRIRSSMDVLQGAVPYALAIGNHDCGPNGDGSTRGTLFTSASYFGPGTPYAMQSSLQGICAAVNEPGNTQNSWHVFRANRVDWLVLTCEWGPRDAVMNWMNQVIAAHPWHRVIIVAHAYLDTATQRYDWATEHSSMNPRAFLPPEGGVNDGENIWQKVVRSYENVCLICCGHSSRAYMRSTGDKGQQVHQMLFNTQSEPQGGEGWLRLLEFLPDDRTVRVRTYSTLLDQWDTAPAADFTFLLSPVSTTDSDGDQMPDYYEARHGFNPSSAVDASADADHDGELNVAEFRAATDPKNGSDVLNIVRCAAGAGGLRWTSVPGMTYELQSSPAPGSVPWTQVTRFTARDWFTDGPFEVPAGVARRFYRIAANPD
jgi:hypothetical protein